jgi:outer membrane protein with beta-barrel domain
MRRVATGVAAALIGLLASAHAARAQGAEFSLGGGVSVPLGTFNDFAKLGWHGLAGVSVVPTGWPVGIQVDGSFSQFSIDSVAGFPKSSVSGVKEQLIYGTGNLVYKFKTSEESRFRPYLIGGGGVYNSKVKSNGSSSGSTTKFGINAGAGFDVKAGSAGLFVEGRFHDVFTNGENLKFIPITAGIRLGGH